jgi:tripartite-type tricarboxylate transporter receptor subunit TctC
MSKKERLFLLSILGIFVTLGMILSACIGSSQAADVKFPDKPIHIIVPMPAGGPHDVLARVIATKGKKHFGVPLVVMNTPGAGGSLGSKQVMTAPPDGYTLLINHGGLSAGYHTGIAEFNYDAFQPICLLASPNACLATYTGAPFKDVKGLVEYAKKNPGRIKYGTTIGGTSHFVTAAIEDAANAKFLLVPYQGEAPRTAALAGHHIDLIHLSVKAASEYVKSGKFTMLGLISPKRSRLYPDLPTLAEQGIKVVDTLEERGMFAPKGTPKDRIAFLESAFKKTLEDPECIDALQNAGQDPAYLDTQTYTQYLKVQDASIENYARRLNLKK